MKVAVLGSAYPLRGGLSSYNERLAREFQKDGHVVNIYTFSLQYPSVFFPGKTQLSDSAAPEELSIKVCLNSVNPFSWIITAKHIRSFAPDILIIKYWLPFMAPSLGSVARMVTCCRKTRVITIVDNMIPHEKRIGDHLLSSYYTACSDGFIAMSESVLNDISIFDKLKPRKLHPHPLFDNFGEAISREEACKRLGVDPQYRYMLFFGFIRDYKGLDLLLKAIRLIGDDLHDVKLVVAGEFYSDEEKYKALESDLGIGDRMIWHDKFISDEEVSAYFSLADLVVQPYKTATQSGVTQIAYHFNKPMIVTNVGGLPELVPDGEVGYVVPVDPESISKAIRKFYLNTDKEAMIQCIQTQKKRFSWSSMKQTILELYQELI